MEDTLDVVKRAEKLRNENGDIYEAINILENRARILRKDPFIMGVDLPLVLRKLATCYRDVGDIDSAYEIYNEALAIAINDNNKIEESDILSSLSFLELKTGSIEKAMEYAQRSLEYIGNKRRGLKFAEARSNAYAVLGNIYFEKEQYDDALESYNIALKTARKAKFVRRELTLLGDIANVHIKKGKLNQALIMLVKSINKAKREYGISVPQYHLRIGRIYIERKEFPEAEKYFKEALKYAKDLKLKRDIAECYEAIGDMHMEKGSKKKGERYYLKAIEGYREGRYKVQEEGVIRKILT